MHQLLRTRSKRNMRLTSPLLPILRAFMQPEIRVPVFRTHSYRGLEGEVNAVAQGREELLIEGT
jgi:hypothetical protein